MILSASRRTDIPALYGPWLLERLRAGYVQVPNPYRARHGIRLRFGPETVDCIVFWTKNPLPVLPLLDRVEGLGYTRYYFSFTITAFGPELEPGLPPLEERVAGFQALSRRLGADRVDWRFDPILLDKERTPQWYARRFSALCGSLAPYTRRCILSFIDPYAHLRGAFPAPGRGQMEETAARLGEAAEKYGLPLFTCAEEGDFSSWGIQHGACIDRGKVEAVAGGPILCKPHRGQRGACGCMESVDIGMYGTCVNGCAYCYATKSRESARQRFREHDPRSPLLAGWPQEGWVWQEKEAASQRGSQLAWF